MRSTRFKLGGVGLQTAGILKVGTIPSTGQRVGVGRPSVFHSSIDRFTSAIVFSLTLFCVYPQLKKLSLEKNMIEGALPTSIAECKALEDLNLANNLIVGPLVHIHWGGLLNLQHLLLANNKVCCLNLFGPMKKE